MKPTDKAILGMVSELPGRVAADKAANLAGCKSPYRQLPVFGRLACPVRAEATKHVLPGPKSLSCPVAVRTAVGTIWEASKLGGLNIKKCLQSRNNSRGKVVSRIEAGSQSSAAQGKADDTDEETGTSSLWDRRDMGPGIRGKIRRITSGRSRWQQGLVATCEDSTNEAGRPK